MFRIVESIKNSLRRSRRAASAAVLAFPKRVQCNVCLWTGRRFLGDGWHESIICPSCTASIRQRLLVAALESREDVGYRRLVDSRNVLHFGPEPVVRDLLRRRASKYQSADLFRRDCDLVLDIGAIALPAECTDLVLAFDVVQGVPDDRKAMAELRRVLRPGGWAILSVPQKDGLDQTLEALPTDSADKRKESLGYAETWRIYGNDFAARFASIGFEVITVQANDFPTELIARCVLKPPHLSDRPLATNYRKVFFGRRN